jgi:hypothetical protein
LAELLAVASPSGGSGEQPQQASNMGQFLTDRLAAPLALDPDVVDSVTALLDRPCLELQPLAGRPLGEALTDPATSLDALETLRDYGKALTQVWEEGPENMVALITYHAAIAAALVFHDRKITSRPRADLDTSLQLLVITPWMTQPMVKLFSEARRLCREPRELPADQAK